MKLVTFRHRGAVRLGAVRDNGVVDLQSVDRTLPASLAALLASDPGTLDRARRASEQGQTVPLADVTLLAPIARPEKVICVGLNYADHAAETSAQLPAEPVFFSKFPSAIIGPEETIVLPRASHEVDYEAELVVVIGTAGRHIPSDRALEHVAGYMCGHDVSARDWQLCKPGKQWLLGKTFDTFAPTGPMLVTPDEVGDAGRLKIQLRLNGRTMQDSSTAQLIFGVDRLIAYVSDVVTLSPGDLIFTGTPAGVGMARRPPVYLSPGDVVEVEIERLGVLRNPVAAELL